MGKSTINGHVFSIAMLVYQRVHWEKNGGGLQSLPLHPFVAELSLLDGMGRVLVAALQDEKDKEIVGVGIGLVHPVPLSDLWGCAKVIPAPVFKVPNSWHFPSHR